MMMTVETLAQSALTTDDGEAARDGAAHRRRILAFTAGMLLMCGLQCGAEAQTPLPHTWPADEIPRHGAIGPSTPAPMPAWFVHLTDVEQRCVAGSIFLENRAHERDEGFTLGEILAMSRAYDATHHVSAVIRVWHDDAIISVFSGALRRISPLLIRRETESACLRTTHRRASTLSPVY